jgi:hypothetical protein
MIRERLLSDGDGLHISNMQRGQQFPKCYGVPYSAAMPPARLKRAAANLEDSFHAMNAGCMPDR